MNNSKGNKVTKIRGNKNRKCKQITARRPGGEADNSINKQVKTRIWFAYLEIDLQTDLKAQTV